MSVDNSAAASRQPAKKSNSAQRIFTQTHAFFYRLSGGKLGGRLGQSPVLLLNTTGRKTGKQRTHPLLYLRDGDNLVLVASNGGASGHPIWWLNLQATPQPEVEIDRQKLSVTACEAGPPAARRAWP